MEQKLWIYWRYRTGTCCRAGATRAFLGAEPAADWLDPWQNVKQLEHEETASGDFNSFQPLLKMYLVSV